MTEITPPKKLADKIWAHINLLNVAPRSEKLNALRTCALAIARLIGPDLTRAGAADRLYTAAAAAGASFPNGEMTRYKKH